MATQLSDKLCTLRLRKSSLARPKEQCVVEGHVPCKRLLGCMHITFHQQHDLRVHQLGQHIHGRCLLLKLQ